MFDPLNTAEITKQIVCSGDRRKYYRFRPAQFYGGIATADCVGCNLRCVFCWSWNVTSRPETCGSLYTPQDVAKRLVGIAKRRKLKKLRISGNEPTICREHLIKVLELIPQDYLFILETNGILIGSDETYAQDLARFANLHVRVSLKGACEEEFSRLTGAIPEAFELQLKALEYLVEHGADVYPACMVSFSTEDRIEDLRKRLKVIHPAFESFEEEELILYPAVEERLRKMNVNHGSAHRPERIQRVKPLLADSS
jgi:uncharacterized Fe-S cluster-containing radical SAM superfamily protein